MISLRRSLNAVDDLCTCRTPDYGLLLRDLFPLLPARNRRSVSRLALDEPDREQMGPSDPSRTADCYRDRSDRRRSRRTDTGGMGVFRRPTPLVCGFGSLVVRLCATVDRVELGHPGHLRSNAEIRKKANTERPTEFGAPKL